MYVLKLPVHFLCITFISVFVKQTKKLSHSVDIHHTTSHFKMTSIISTFITKTLCDNLGGLDFETLNAIITKNFTVADSLLRSVLFDDGKFAIRGGKQKVVGDRRLAPDSLIVAKTSLRLCQVKNGQCLQCSGLHLCKFVVCGECRFG